MVNGKEALVGPRFGSYTHEQVKWLLKDISEYDIEAPTEDREERIQNGGGHYAESLPIEFVPSNEYQELFKESLEESKHRVALATAVVAEQIWELKRQRPVLVSLARAGVPVGILIKEYLKKYYNYDAPHYAISIVRGKGIDDNALQYIIDNHDGEQVIFIDGWTGKGAITKELEKALDEYFNKTGINLGRDLAVLADPAKSVRYYGTQDDFLIPSACLNSTVSGLISRTVLNDEIINDDEFHGAKFYKEFRDNDYSQYFITKIYEEFTESFYDEVLEAMLDHTFSSITFEGWKYVEKISEEYGINDVNLVKPGVGETTRVLLRRVPWKILINPKNKDDVKHILMLAKERNVDVVEVDDLAYSAIGLIHPKFTKGATGFTGRTEK